MNATLGFGRSHIAPLISEFVKKYPQVDIQLQLSVNPPPSGDDTYDICFRFGGLALHCPVDCGQSQGRCGVTRLPEET